MTKLAKPARVGCTTFQVGVDDSLVVQAAQRQYEQDRPTLGKLQCPECLSLDMELERTVGWMCTVCEAGPYMVDSNGLQPKPK